MWYFMRCAAAPVKSSHDKRAGKQARKSSEDTHLTGYTPFEKVFGLGKLWVKKLSEKTLKKNTLSKN